MLGVDCAHCCLEVFADVGVMMGGSIYVQDGVGRMGFLTVVEKVDYDDVCIRDGEVR